MRNSPRLPLIVGLTLMLMLVGGAGDGEPQSTKAKAALRKYERTVAKAKADYDQAVAAAGKTLSAELDEALKVAMKSGSLEEANRIKAAKDERGAADPGAAPFDGTWAVVYGNGITRRYVIRAGRMAIEEGERKWTGQIRVKDGTVLADVSDHQGPKLERLTMVGGRFFIEHYHPAQTYPDGVAQVFGVAARQK